jgi:hypothetical protein
MISGKDVESGVIDFLAKAGADVNFRIANAERSLLHRAAVDGIETVVRALVRNGANREDVFFKFSEKGKPGYPVHAALRQGGREHFIPLLTPPGEDVTMRAQRELWGGELDVTPFDFTFLCCTQCRRRPEEYHSCGGCGLTAYCNVVCQKAHWKRHKKVCLQKRRTDEFRLALKAKRDKQAAEE